MKTQIVLLKTKDKSAPIWIEEMGENITCIRQVIHDPSYSREPDNVLGYSARRHIHLTTDEQIVTGDWYIDDSNQVRKCSIDDVESWPSFNNKKIVASTDQSLGLPTISKDWIRDVFIPANGKLTEVN